MVSHPAGEILGAAEPFLLKNMHPTVIVRAYHQALEDALAICESIAVSVDVSDPERMRSLIRSCIGTKFVSRYGDLICDMALDAVMKVTVDVGGRKEIDIKKFAKVEKVCDGPLSPPFSASCHGHMLADSWW
jgi:T-complex protein 1 subunit gamma